MYELSVPMYDHTINDQDEIIDFDDRSFLSSSSYLDFKDLIDINSEFLTSFCGVHSSSPPSQNRNDASRLLMTREL